MGKKILLVLVSAFWGFVLAKCIYALDFPHRGFGIAVCVILFLAGLVYIMAETWDKESK